MFSDSLLILTILNQNYKGYKPIRRENEMHQLYTHYILGIWFQCKMTVSDLAEHDWSSTTVYMYIHN